MASEEAKRFWAAMRDQPKDANPSVEQRRQGDEYAEVLSSEPAGVAFAPAPAVNGLWAEPPEARPGASQGNTTLVVRLETAPADSLTMSGTLIVEEF